MESSDLFSTIVIDPNQNACLIGNRKARHGVSGTSGPIGPGALTSGDA